MKKKKKEKKKKERKEREKRYLPSSSRLVLIVSSIFTYLCLIDAENVALPQDFFIEVFNRERSVDD